MDWNTVWLALTGEVVQIQAISVTRVVAIKWILWSYSIQEISLLVLRIQTLASLWI